MQQTATTQRDQARESADIRESVYSMFSALYFKELDANQIKTLAQQDFSSVEDLDPDISEGIQAIRKSLQRVHSGTREDLAIDYAHTFLSAGSTKHERRACPYESVFTSELGLLMQDARDDAYRYMLAEHVEPDERLHIPEDHVSFELEFMASLCARLSTALETEDDAEARRLLDVQRSFHANHLLNWIDEFTTAVQRCCRTGFYRGVAQMTRGFVRLDTELIGETERLANLTAM